MISALFLLAMAALDPTAPSAPNTNAPRKPWLAGPFSFYVENDSLPIAGGDESFTQGLELHLSLTRHPWPALYKPLRLLRRGRQFDEQASVFFGQTIFTPQNIITYSPRQDDRPFVGYLYGGLSTVLVAPDWGEDLDGRTLRPRRMTGQLIVGVTGDLAGAHTAQSAFHVLRESRIPKGWYTQAGNRPEANALFVWEYIPVALGKNRDLLDVTMVFKGALGTTQTYAGFGGVLRVGWGLSAFPPLNIPFSADQGKPKKSFEAAVFAGAEARAFARNRLADQGGEGRPTFVPLVYEWRLGAMGRWRNGLSLSYSVTRRSQEIEPLPPGLVASHWVGAVQIAKTAGTSGCECYGFLKGVRANLRLGRGVSSVDPGLPADPRVSLAAHWGLEKSLFSGRYAVAVETTGVAREHGRSSAGGPADGHKDTFLLAKALTLGREMLPNLASRHRVQLRLGGGMAATKTQTTPTEGGIDEPELPAAASETGSSALVGVRYALRLGKPASVATDLAYSRLFLDGSEGGVRRAAYWSWTVGVQVHFWGRDRIETDP